jgi:methionyl-tRNA synthetase
MTRPKFFITTAIDYPNSRPHIGTAFEKLGADVQARYRRMHGFDVFLLMGNDENTVKVAKRAAELGQDTKAYCDDMAGQFKEIWTALDISFDTFVQTSEERHAKCCRAFIQKVFDNGYIRKDFYEGWYCEGCESFKTEKELIDGKCPLHPNITAIKRKEPSYFFEQSKFQDWLLKFHEENPDFVQPESRRNEILEYIKEGLRDVNITRVGEQWGIRVPWDQEFTIWVWFDALLTYMTGIGYATDDAEFQKWWPADIHFIGKDITRFHCALWPAMLKAAGLAPPKMVFGHGFVYKKSEEGVIEKLSKSLGNIVEPMDVVTKFSAEAFRYFFMRECPFPGDGEFSWQRFADVYNSELANNLGNLYSRVVTLITKNYGGVLEGTATLEPEPIAAELELTVLVKEIAGHVEACQYNQALQKLVLHYLTPANQYLETHAPWKLVKTDLAAAKKVLFNAIQPLRVAAILLKPFIPRSAETIYRSFNFHLPWEDVTYDVAPAWMLTGDLHVLAELDAGKVKPLFPRIG